VTLARRSLFALAGLAAVGLAGCGSSDDGPGKVASVGERPGGYAAGTQLDDVWTLPDTPLTGSDGSSTSLAKAASTVTLVFFGYTHCPDVCTGILADLSSAVQRLEPAAAEKVAVLFVTTDPARDTPEVMQQYLARIDEKFLGLTGELSDISAIAKTMGIAIEQGTKLPSGGYEIEHGSQVIGFGSTKKAQVLWTEGTTVANYKDDIALLVSRQE